MSKTCCVFSGELGLEVCPGREATTEYGMGDEWTPCDPQEGAITVNVGDALMYWSDDKLKVSSAPHRSHLQPDVPRASHGLALTPVSGDC